MRKNKWGRVLPHRCKTDKYVDLPVAVYPRPPTRKKTKQHELYWPADLCSALPSLRPQRTPGNDGLTQQRRSSAERCKHTGLPRHCACVLAERCKHYSRGRQWNRPHLGPLYDFCSLAVAVFSKILLWEPFLLRGFLCSGAFVAIRCTCLAVTARLYINKSQIRDDLKWQEQVPICRAELQAQTAQWHAEGRVEQTYFPFESDSDED